MQFTGHLRITIATLSPGDKLTEHAVVYTEPMEHGTKSDLAPWVVVLILGTTLTAHGGCNKKSSRPNPWALALPKTTAAYGLPQVADAKVTVNRGQLLVSGKPLLKLKDGRLPGATLRDGPDGLYVPALASALAPLAKQRPDGGASYGRLAVHCQPAVPFRTLRAVLYTAMRAGFKRPWLVAEGAKGKRVGLPLELPSVPSKQSHNLRSSPTRTPALAIGYDGQRLHVTRWGRPDCPSDQTAPALGCAALGTGLNKFSLGKIGTHLRHRYRTSAQRPGRRRPSSNAVMVWVGMDVVVGDFVRLLDAVREGPGGLGSCKLIPDEPPHRWKRTSPLLDPTGKSTQGCLYYQIVLVWSQPGHRKPPKR